MPRARGAPLRRYAEPKLTQAAAGRRADGAKADFRFPLPLQRSRSLAAHLSRRETPLGKFTRRCQCSAR